MRAKSELEMNFETRDFAAEGKNRTLPTIWEGRATHGSEIFTPATRKCVPPARLSHEVNYD